MVIRLLLFTITTNEPFGAKVDKKMFTMRSNTFQLLLRPPYTKNSITYRRIAFVEKLHYERNVFANPMKARSTSSKISQQQQYSCLPRYFSRLMDQITRGRAYIIGTGREDFIPTSQHIYKNSRDLKASLLQWYIPLLTS